MRTILLLPLVWGCASAWTMADAESDYVGRYADAMAGACHGTFVLHRQRSEVVILTQPGIIESEVRIETCDRTLTMTLDCRMPSESRGPWSCSAHGLPELDRTKDDVVAVDELAAVMRAVEAAGCRTDPLRLERRRIESSATEVRSAYSVVACERQWQAEAACERSWSGQRWRCTASADATR